ncbi:hypothetical protein J2S46_000759 [Kitasatospora herbaricolor]|uniref:hypothetical protein n=1 Tax=Kitasatospora herbaricolor TaxID=68217 RepID=UPI00174CD2D0|nr:hypothetical protein [Kitasatospora herbaricolor]MDQ0306203.1 hypothetical protein [Kitasatospora herbaricolor]
MILVLLGLLILAVAAVVAVAGIFANAGGAHELTNSFSVFGHQVGYRQEGRPQGRRAQ